jgi:hypothetical protein
MGKDGVMRSGGGQVRSAFGLAGVGLGAGLMFLLDPNAGRRRRKRARDRLVHASRRLTAASGAIARDLGHRTAAVPAKVRGLFRRSAPDEIVEERIRSALGRVCSHPGAIDVICDGGRVQLSGAILERERRAVVATVRRVRGVKAVDDLLEPHPSAEQVPDLQGASRPVRRPKMLRRRWGPAMRFLGATAGAALLAAAQRARGRAAWALGGAGAILLARGLLNAPLEQLAGVGAGHGATSPSLNMGRATARGAQVTREEITGGGGA